MIGTFWNLCRACPAKPVDKLHSEYRSTYRWHEYTGPRPRQDDAVIRGQPPPSGGPGPAPEPEAPRLRPPGGARRVAHEDHLRADAPDNSEPILPRRRKHPLLAYRCHEVLGLTAAASEDCLDSARGDRFRSSERRGPRGRGAAAGGLWGGRRSKSEGPPGCPQSRPHSPQASPQGSPGPHQPRRGGRRAVRGPRGAAYLVGLQSRQAQSDSEPDEQGPDMSRSTPRKTVKMVAGAADGADLRAAGLPTDRQNPHESRRHFDFSRGPAAAAALAAPGGGMEAAVHSAVLAASRPAAGKMSGMAVGQPAPRKSLSMGALRAQQQRSRVADQDRTDDAGEMEPLMASQDHADDDMRGEEKIREDNISKEDKPRKEFKTEYKKKFRPFSQYEYVEGRFLKRRGDDAPAEQPEPPPQPQQPWYAEVIELRKKAGEYKHRGWGTELAPEHISELYSKQILLWEQVSKRSSLSALSLAAVAASPRSISKEEKERENSRRTSPTKASSLGRPRPHTAQPKLAGVHERSKSEKGRKTEKTDDNKKETLPRSSRKEFPLRHHLERTTGAEDGALLLSPTREKLEPVPRRTEDPSASPKRAPGLAHTGRSQSLGPGGAPETRSPKRSPRPATSTTPAPAAPAAPAERRPRPTTLNTTAPSRSKSRTSASASLPSKGFGENKPQRAASAASSKGSSSDPKKAPRPEKETQRAAQRGPPTARARPARERALGTPSPAPPSKPEPARPAAPAAPAAVSLTESETLLALSPSPVPTDTPSPSQTCSELGSRVASPATLEVMSICQNTASPSTSLAASLASSPTTLPTTSPAAARATSKSPDPGLADGLADLNGNHGWNNGHADVNTANGWNHGLAGLNTTNGWKNGLADVNTTNGWNNGLADLSANNGNGLGSLTASSPDLLTPSAFTPNAPEEPIHVADLLAFADTSTPLVAKVKPDSLLDGVLDGVLDGAEAVAALKPANGVLADVKETVVSSSPSENLLDTSLTC